MNLIKRQTDDFIAVRPYPAEKTASRDAGFAISNYRITVGANLLDYVMAKEDVNL